MDQNTTIDVSSTVLHPTPLLPFMSDKHLSLLAPVIVYWLYSGMYHLISVYKVPLFDKYRIQNSKETETMNKVSLGEVIKAVLVQQFIQTLLGLTVAYLEGEDILPDDAVEMFHIGQTLKFCATKIYLWQTIEPYHDVMVEATYWYIMPILKFALAMFFLDTWQYFVHRLFHMNKFLYRHVHSRHHRLYAPYAFGALYNHPFEGFLFDSLGSVIATELSGLTTRSTLVFFTFATIKTVDDHCGYDLPFNPLQRMFRNNSAYHAIHHQTYGMKKNFSAPFFTMWDRILGTYMSAPPKSSEIVKDRTTTINSLSLKADSNSDYDSKAETVNSEISTTGRYNLRSRKNIT
ncbi:17375_t:CDS:2 [Acaulospora morrowiae]|uniref:17375_t:CDS:1 n=1 Tax=Acaulospora morrowiae TaxID=94023 RepID=A0A9N8VNB0_9GLOM|nr:17375_t:CDS:2 [Acaulospora morrowiae]